MGRSYNVPRSVKGESRLLVIFTMKSLATTILFGGAAAAVVFLIKDIVGMSILQIILSIAPFAVIGYGIGAFKIPDAPIMGPLRKAGGEEVLDILIRLVAFPRKKKLYIYGKDRKLNNEKKTGAKLTSIAKLRK